MLFLYGALVALFWLVLAIALPVLSLVRTTRVQRTVADLTERLQRLEEKLTRVGAQPEPIVPPVQTPAGESPVAAAPFQPDPPFELPAIETPAGNESAHAPQVPPFLPDPAEVVAARQVPAATPHDSLEARIGSRWMLYVGVATLVLGVGFFVKYAFENQWVNETARVLVGALCGALLVAAGLRFVKAGYVAYGRMLAGGGFAVLYLSVYAAFNFYSLIGPLAAFGLLFAVSAAAGLLADRQNALGLALMAVGGGFLTPFVIGGGVDRQVALFTYDAVLVLLTLWLAGRHAWPELNLLSFVLTGATLCAWAIEFYRPSKYLTTELFLTAFGAMFLVVLHANRRSTGWRARSATMVLSTGPLLYHAASLLILTRHSLALLVYLIAFTLCGIAYATAARMPILRLVVWIAAALPFFGWLVTHTTPMWLSASVATLLAIYGLHLIAQIDLVYRPDGRFRSDDVVLFHLNGLGLFAGGYLIVDAINSERTGALAAMLTIWNLALAWRLRVRDGDASLQAIALAFALAATAVGLQFEGAWLTIGWAAEGAFVAWLGLRSRRVLMRIGGLLLLVTAITRLLSGNYFETPAAFTAILNPRVGATLFIIVLLGWMARVHRGQSVDRFIILANLLAILMITAEINSYWRFRYDWASAYLARGLTLSMAWAGYAIMLVIVGIWRRYAPLRYLAIALFGVTILKVFFVDLSELSGIYRIAGFLVLGAILLSASFLYERARSRLSPANEPDAAGA